MYRKTDRPILVPHEKVVCRYFLRSTCREGDRCYFSHDVNTAYIPDKVCRYFLQHRCEYGPQCKFEHVRIQPPCYFKCVCENTRNTEKSLQTNSDAAKRKDNEKHSISNNSKDNNSNTGKQNVNREYSVSDSKVKDKQNYSNNRKETEIGESNDDKNKRNAAAVRKYMPNFGWFDPDIILSTWSYGDTSASDLCAYFISGPCPFGEKCPYTHGFVCELCGTACLSPSDEEQRKAHTEQCEKDLIADMELSFAIQRSVDKTCGVCMENVLEKSHVEERRFGILENCNHVFCLSCIRKWRKTKQEERTDWDPVNTRSCPHCRVVSDFIVPSQYWFETEKDKEKLITDFKEAMGQKPCKYFKQGEGNCPFGGLCFYLHAKPDGTIVELPPPSRRRRRRTNVDDLDSIALSLSLDDGLNWMELQWN